MRLVLVEWLDSVGVGSEWGAIADTKEPPDMICYSVGWLLVDGDRYKVIVPHVHYDNPEVGAVKSGCGDMSIPTVAVRRMVDLKEA